MNKLQAAFNAIDNSGNGMSRDSSRVQYEFQKVPCGSVGLGGSSQELWGLAVGVKASLKCSLVAFCRVVMWGFVVLGRIW